MDVRKLSAAEVCSLLREARCWVQDHWHPPHCDLWEAFASVSRDHETLMSLEEELRPMTPGWSLFLFGSAVDKRRALTFIDNLIARYEAVLRSEVG